MNQPAEVINFVSKKKIICTAHEWKNMEREDAFQKECAARRKQKGLDPIAYRNVWNHIKLVTWEDDKCQK
tara:strand:+ start:336 stop:545 length:210 start_codon:yes stop_codon:yes gene_type:complete